MSLTYRLSNSHVALNGPPARSEQVETSLGQDLNNILLDLSRAGPFGLFRVWRERWHYRRALARLLIVGSYMIDDIGLTVDQAMAEMDQLFWRR
jgi:uncharacterized protein YjiS (DUF1127 family)